MAGVKIPKSLGELELVFIVFYRLRTLTDEEKQKWFNEWADLRKHLPDGLEIVIEGYGAFGTPYTGFTVYKGPMEKFREHLKELEEKSASFVEKTRTIIGTKGFNLPLVGLKTILERRPVD